jgi:LysM repeat protein
MPAKKSPGRRIRAVVEEVPTSTTPVTVEKIESAEEKAKQAIEELEALKNEKIREAQSHDGEAILQEEEPKPVEKEKQVNDNTDGVSIKLVVVVAVLTAIVVAIVSGGVYVYYTGITSQVEEEVEVDSQESTPSPVPSPTPEPEAKVDVDVSKLKVSVLNGSGQIGAAGTAKSIIEKVDFKVVDTGNAANFNFTDTLIEVKKSVPNSVVSLLKEALSEKYTVKIGDNLSATEEFDIIITVGQVK